MGTKPASLSVIAKKADIKRTTAYNYISSLLEQGLLSKSVVGKRIVYTAEKPNKLSILLEERKVVLDKLLPDLQNLYNTISQQPRVEFYEGKKGIEIVYKKIFATTKIIYAIFSPERAFKVFTKEENEQFFTLLYKNGGLIYDLLEEIHP